MLAPRQGHDSKVRVRPVILKGQTRSAGGRRMLMHANVIPYTALRP